MNRNSNGGSLLSKEKSKKTTGVIVSATTEVKEKNQNVQGLELEKTENYSRNDDSSRKEKNGVKRNSNNSESNALNNLEKQMKNVQINPYQNRNNFKSTIIQVNMKSKIKIVEKNRLIL